MHDEFRDARRIVVAIWVVGLLVGLIHTGGFWGMVGSILMLLGFGLTLVVVISFFSAR